MKKYTCRCGNSFKSEQKPLCCPACLQQKDFVEGNVENPLSKALSPCNIGDKIIATVFRPYNGNKATIHGKVIAMSKNKKTIRVIYNSCRIIDFYHTDLGKTVFVLENS